MRLENYQDITNQTSAISLSAIEMSEKWRTLEIGQQNSYYLNQKFAELDSFWKEYNQEGWDGYDADPIDFETFINARFFLKSISPSKDIPTPDIVPVPNGSISFDWYYSPSKQISFDINRKGQISFAGVNNRQRFFGQFDFSLDYMPEMINTIKTVSPQNRLIPVGSK